MNKNAKPKNESRPKIKQRELLDPRERAFHVRCYDTAIMARPLKPPACKLPEPKGKAGAAALKRDRELGVAGNRGYFYVGGSK